MFGEMTDSEKRKWSAGAWAAVEHMMAIANSSGRPESRREAECLLDDWFYAVEINLPVEGATGG